MEKKTLDRIEEVLGLSYGQRFDPGIVTMIDEVFGEEDDFIVESAIGNCIKVCQHPPTISVIHTEVANMRMEQARQDESVRQKELYSGEKPQSSAKAEFFKINWKKEFRRLVSRREYVEKAVKDHFRLDFLHPNRETRTLHSDIMLMGRQIYTKTHWSDDLELVDVAKGVIAAVKDRLEQENARRNADGTEEGPDPGGDRELRSPVGHDPAAVRSGDTGVVSPVGDR